jgi:hypothetical protein
MYHVARQNSQPRNGVIGSTVSIAVVQSLADGTDPEDVVDLSSARLNGTLTLTLISLIDVDLLTSRENSRALERMDRRLLAGFAGALAVPSREMTTLAFSKSESLALAPTSLRLTS